MGNNLTQRDSRRPVGTIGLTIKLVEGGGYGRGGGGGVGAVKRPVGDADTSEVLGEAGEILAKFTIAPRGGAEVKE